MSVLDRLVLSDEQWAQMAPRIIGRPDQRGSTGATIAYSWFVLRQIPIIFIGKWRVY